ncbi:MAG TPA: TonB family protein, partial [Terriglobia bacterium]|nr:TonB family protein [Terriglobia bacterium]
PRLTPLPPPPPPSVIRPDDVIADGARPDATPRASRGSTPEPARPGSLSPQPSLPQPAAPPAPPSPPPAAPAAPPSNPRNAGPGNDGLSALAANAGAPHGALPAQIANSNSSALRLPSLGGGRVSGAVDNAIQNAANNRPRSTSSLGRTGTDQGLELPNFSAEEPQILSDTRGYDFGPYLNQVVNRVRVNWYSLIPQSVRYNGQRGRVVLTFTIIKTGEVRELSLRLGSGADPLDRAAMGSITASNPFQQLPSNFDGDHLTLQFTFLYNYSLP